MRGRDSLIVIGTLVAVSVVAWVLTVREMGTMGLGLMTPSMTMGRPVSATNAGLYILLWGVMMVAMMFPSIAPMVILFSTISRRKRDQVDPFVPAWVFVVGYTLVWTLTGSLAYAGDVAIQSLPHTFPGLRAYGAALGGGLLVLAGLYQLTPLKSLCLTRCRSPLGFLLQHWREGAWGAFRMGFHHGAFCLGCCWSLMTVMFVMGTMNLVWMGILALVIFVEKVVPHGAALGKGAGIALIVLGLLLAAYPGVGPTPH